MFHLLVQTDDWRAGDQIQRPTTVTIHILKDLKQQVISKATQMKLGMLPKEYPHAVSAEP